MPQSQATREDPNTFAKLGIKPGTELEYIADPENKVVVHDSANQVRCLDDSQVMSISAAAEKFHPEPGARSGYRRFRIVGERVSLASRHPETGTPELSLADQFHASYHPTNPLELARSLHQFNQEVGPGPGYLFDYAEEMLMPAVLAWSEDHAFPNPPLHYTVYFRDDSDLRREYPARTN